MSCISYEVIIIEDNSPDGTLEVAQQLQVSQDLKEKMRINSSICSTLVQAATPPLDS